MKAIVFMQKITLLYVSVAMQHRFDTNIKHFHDNDVSDTYQNPEKIVDVCKSEDKDDSERTVGKFTLKDYDAAIKMAWFK